MRLGARRGPRRARRAAAGACGTRRPGAATWSSAGSPAAASTPRPRGRRSRPARRSPRRPASRARSARSVSSPAGAGIASSKPPSRSSSVARVGDVAGLRVEVRRIDSQRPVVGGRHHRALERVRAGGTLDDRPRRGRRAVSSPSSQPGSGRQSSSVNAISSARGLAPADVPLPRRASRAGLDPHCAQRPDRQRMAVEQLEVARVGVVVDEHDLVALRLERLLLERVQQPPQPQPAAMRGHDDADFGMPQAPDRRCSPGGATQGFSLKPSRPVSARWQTPLRRILRREESGPRPTQREEPRNQEIVGVDDADAATIERVLPYTMTGVPRVRAVIDAVRYCVRSGTYPGAFAECGVWRGGSGRGDDPHAAAEWGSTIATSTSSTRSRG